MALMNGLSMLGTTMYTVITVILSGNFGYRTSHGTRSALLSKSKSKSHCDWRSVGRSVGQSVSKPWCRAPLIVTVWQLRSRFCGAPSLTRGRMSFVYAAGPCQRSLSWVHILLSQIWDFPFRRLLRLEGHGGGIRPRLHTGFLFFSILWKYKPGVASNGINFLPNFTQICPAFLGIETSVDKHARDAKWHTILTRAIQRKRKKKNKLFNKITSF
jgi:hypothetical protein